MDYAIGTLLFLAIFAAFAALLWMLSKLLDSVLSHRQPPGRSDEDQPGRGGRNGRRPYEAYQYPYNFERRRF